MSKLDRIVQIDALIRGGSYPSLQTFVERFEMRERTIYEDLAYLRDSLGAPLRYSRMRGGYTYSNASWALPTVIMTEGELLAFFLSAELVHRYLGTSVEQPLRSALAKIAARLPERSSIDLSILAKHFTFRAGATSSADPQLLVALSSAIVERSPIQMTYFTAGRGERNERTIEPYHLYNVRGDWQVIGYDHLRGQFRNFAVARIETWEVLTDQRFQRNPDFSVEQHLASGFLAERGDQVVEVAIWFDPQQAHYIREREWHPTQRTEEHADGALTLHFWTGALAEVRRWVMSYGAHALVLAPPELVEAVTTESAAMAQRYSGKNLP